MLSASLIILKTSNDFVFNVRKLITHMNVLYDFDESIFFILNNILQEYKNSKDNNIQNIIKVFSEVWKYYYNHEKTLDMYVYRGVENLINLTEVYM